MLEKGINYGVNGGLDRLDVYATITLGTQTDSMGCSDREPDSGSVFPTSVGEMPALDLTPVSEMSLGKGDLTGLFVVTTPLVGR